jgi:phage terminase small subunit
MTKDEVLAILRRDNPKSRQQDLVLYADIFVQYREAADNVEKNGSVCAHPRTGAPMPNPFAAVQSRCLADLGRIKSRLNTDALWRRGITGCST